MNVLRVGNLSVASGQKLSGMFQIQGTDEKLPVTLVNGINEGKTICVSAGVHGSEYNGIEAINRLSKIIEPSKISGQIIFIHVVNVNAFYGKSQYVNPIDKKNFAAVFPGRCNGTLSEKIAYEITENIIKKSDFVIDLHSGDLHEDLDCFGWFDTNEDTRELSMKAAELMNVNFIGTSHESLSIMGAAAKLNIPGISPEVGGNGAWNNHYVQIDIDGVINILKMLDIIEGQPVVKHKINVKNVSSIKCKECGCFYPIVKNGDVVKKHQPLGVIKDFFGNIIAEYESTYDGEIFCIARSLAVKSGDLLFGLKY